MPTKIKSSTAAPMTPATNASIETLPTDEWVAVVGETWGTVTGPLVIVGDGGTRLSVMVTEDVKIIDELLVSVGEPVSVGKKLGLVGEFEGRAALSPTEIVVSIVEQPKPE
jgi:hypothetical protein